MNAIILAAGRGSRLKSLTEEKPKCLTEIEGRTLLSRQIEALTEASIQKIGIVRGYMAEKISVEGAKYFENLKWMETNMFMSLVCAEEWLKNNTCIISYSDIIFPAETVELLIRAEGDIAITYNTEWLKVWEARFEDPLSDAETFKLDKDGCLIEIGKRANKLSDIEGQYMGLLKFTPAGWNSIIDCLKGLPEEKIKKMDMTTLLNLLLVKGIKINTVPVKGKWFEIDSEDDIKAFETFSGRW